MSVQTFRSAASLLPLVLVFIMLSCKMHKDEVTPDSAIKGNNIVLSDAQIQLANINIEGIREASIGRKLTLTGVLKVNEQSAISFSSWISGRIEKLYFRNTGERVKKGDMLMQSALWLLRPLDISPFSSLFLVPLYFWLLFVILLFCALIPIILNSFM